MSEEISNLKKDIVFLYDSQKALIRELQDKLKYLENDIESLKKDIDYINRRLLDVEQQVLR